MSFIGLVTLMTNVLNEARQLQETDLMQIKVATLNMVLHCLYVNCIASRIALI